MAKKFAPLPTRGFSLLEILIATAVVTVGILSIAGAVAYSTKVGAQAARQTRALQFAKQIIQLSKLYNLPKTAPIVDSPAARNPIDAAPFSALIAPDANYRRNVRMVPLALSPTDYRSQLYQIDVSVYWFDRGREVSLQDVAIHRAP